MIARLREEGVVFLLALQFLTRLPIPVRGFTPERMQATARYYPLVGLLVGGLGALVYGLALQLFPPLVAVLLSVVATLLATGAFHEDGLADTFDGVGGGTDQAGALEIMKDSRLGTYGTLALGVALALKVAALAELPGWLVLLALPLAHAASRASAVLVIASSRYVRAEGTGKPTAEGISARSLALALGSVLLIWGVVGWFEPLFCGFGPIAGLAFGHLAMRLFFEDKLGGYTGDALGAVQQGSEIGLYLGLLAALELSL